MSDRSADDATEAPTAKRLLEAREAGDLPVSRDVAILAGLAGGVFGASVLMPPAIRRLGDQMADFLASVDRIHLTGAHTDGTVLRLLVSALTVILAVAGPAIAGTIGAFLLQTGFYVGGTPIHFTPGRINPGAGLGRLLSKQNLMEFLKACGRLLLLVGVIWSVLGHNPFAGVTAAQQGVSAILPTTLARIDAFVKPLLVALGCLAAFDIFLVRMRHARKLRMTREEVRRESRESEGDPIIKGKLRRLRAQRARRRMMEKVKTADVIITNPTHYAIALSYDRARNAAPRIVAKGVDFIAMRIREEATAHGVPIMPNPPLARALYQIELDHEIPAEHYQAVAEVIAFVWKIRNRLRAPVS